MKNNKDKKEVLAAVKKFGLALEYADKSLQKDKAIVLAAVKQDGYALGYADKSLRKDRAIVLAAVKQDGSALQFADKSLRKDKAIVLAAIKQYIHALEYADKSLQKDKAIVLVVVKQDGQALQYADKSLQKDTAIVLAAVKQDGLALEFASVSLRKDKEVVIAAIKQNKDALQYDLSSLKESSEGVYKNLIKLENLKGKKLTKIAIYFARIGERESMSGTYFFEDGTSRAGGSYNNNVLNGSIEFSNNEDSISLNEFLQGLKDQNWTQHVIDSIDNFDGEGKSIDYDEDEFERYEEGNSDGCEYDVEQDPSTISFYFGDKEIEFKNGDNSYIYKNIFYSKEDIANLLKSLMLN